MPRIPSVADVNPVGAAVSRLPTVRGKAEHFGLEAVEGMTKFGQAAAEYVRREGIKKHLKEQEKKAETEGERGDDQSLADAAGANKEDQLASSCALVETEKAKVSGWDIAQAAVDSIAPGEPSPQQAAKKAVQAFDQGRTDIVAAVPAEQRPAVQAQLAPVRHSVEVRAQQRAHNQAVEKAMQDIEGVLQAYKTQALREPEMAEKYVSDADVWLRALAGSGILTLEQYGGRSQAFRRSVSTELLRSQSAIDAVADLKAGVYDEALGDPALKELLLTEMTQRLEVERAQGVAGTNWLVARARQGAAVPSELQGHRQRILGAEGVAEEAAHLDRVRRVASELEAWRYAPEALLRRAAANMPLAWDTRDAKESLETQEEFRAQAEEMLRRRQEDPAAYVMGLPGIAEAFAAAEANPALLPEAIAGRLAAQDAIGLAPDQQNALTLAERVQVIAALQQLAPEQRTAALRELQKAYGEQAATVVADLVEAGLPLNESLTADLSGGPDVSGRLAQAGESQAGAKTPEGGVIEAAAEKLIAQGQEATGGLESENRAPQEAMSIGSLPPLPLRKPLDGAEVSQTGSPAAYEPHTVQLKYDGESRADEPAKATNFETLTEGMSPAQASVPVNRVLRFEGDPRDQIATILKLGDTQVGDTVYQIDGVDLDRALALAQDTLGILDTVREEGLGGLNAHRARIGKLMKDFIQDGSLEGQALGRALQEMTNRLVGNPLGYPALLTKDELLYGGDVLLGMDEEGMSAGTKLAVAGTVADGIAWWSRKGNGVGWAIDIAGLVAGLSSDKRQELLKGIRAERRRRGFLPAAELEESPIKSNLSRY